MTQYEIVAAFLFAGMLLHVFFAGAIHKMAHRFRGGSLLQNILEFLGEAEVVPVLWSALLFGYIALTQGYGYAVHYIEERSFVEPIFVVAIMSIAATAPVVQFASTLIDALASGLTFVLRKRAFAEIFSALVLGTMAGSFITEPAAITLTATLLGARFYSQGMSKMFAYVLLGALLTNISIGGSLTPFAAPPVLMVAEAWELDTPTMVRLFGWKSLVACVLTAIFVIILFRKELGQMTPRRVLDEYQHPWWLTASYLFVMGFVVYNSHHPVVVIPTLLAFMVWDWATFEYRLPPHEREAYLANGGEHPNKGWLNLRPGLMVGLFLAGLVILCPEQESWIKPALEGVSPGTLYVMSTGLTTITDNAALTSLGKVIGFEGLSRVAVLAGALAGGGMTPVANAPNPAGITILKGYFPDGQISVAGLAMGATIPTLIAMICLWYLPNL